MWFQFVLIQGAKNGVMPQHNEYFSNAAEGQTKVAEWVGYIFPVPLNSPDEIYEAMVEKGKNYYSITVE